jgi:DNA polymerase III subunit epsilon
MRLLELAECFVSELTFIALDTETTGLGEAHLVEVAAVKYRRSKVLEEFSTLVNPGRHIPSYVTAIHGITDAMVKDAPRASRVLPSLRRFINGGILIAHNASFDIKVLTAELYRSRLPIPDVEALDSCRITRRLFRRLPNHRLGTIAEAFGLANRPEHRALSDARAVMQIFEHCLEILPQPSTLGLLLEANGTPYSFARAVESSHLIRRRWPFLSSAPRTRR